MSNKDESKDQVLEQEAAGAVPAVETGGEPEKIEGKDLGAEVETLKQQLAQCQDRMLRMAADFDNAKKRLERESQLTLKFAEENILRELLPAIDNLERAMEQGRETSNIEGLLDGLALTLAGLLGTLEKFGVKQLGGVGSPFDPNLHEAMAMEASTKVPANSVIKEYQKGYLYKDRLLRAAKVVVSSGGSAGQGGKC